MAPDFCHNCASEAVKAYRDCSCRVPQKKKYERVKTMDDDEEDDDEKDLIADEIFHGDGDGDLEEGEAVDEPLPRGDDDEEGEDEESGKRKDLGEAENEKSTVDL